MGATRRSCGRNKRNVWTVNMESEDDGEREYGRSQELVLQRIGLGI
jgi:hypothetical protein